MRLYKIIIIFAVFCCCAWKTLAQDSGSDQPSIGRSICESCQDCGPLDLAITLPDLGDENNDDDTDNDSSKRRSRRVKLSKRGPHKTSKKIGSCNVEEYTNKPSYPSVSNIKTGKAFLAAKKGKFWAVPHPGGKGCMSKLGWDFYDDKKIGSKSSYTHPDNGKEYLFRKNSSSQNPNFVNIDHVCKFLLELLSFALTKNG